MSSRLGPRTNLPVERGAFVGRLQLIDELGRLLDDGHRLVSLVGPEGIGKTRLALRAASLELPRFGASGGVWLLDLSAASDAAGLVRELLLVQGFLPDPSAVLDVEMQRALRGFAGTGPSLLVLDAVASDDTARLLGVMLAQAPEIVMLVTARTPVGAQNERVVRVGPLKTPRAGSQDARALLATEAVQLFIERAGEARRGYVPSLVDLRAVAQIVRQLEGVPLAIEIAAARLRALTASELLERLPRNVRLLAGDGAAGEGGKTAQGQRVRRTLAGAVAWSLDLLPPWEQDALMQAAIFRGGFDVDAAQAVMDLRAHADAPPTPVVLAALLEKSLLRVRDSEIRAAADPLIPGVILPSQRRFDLPGAVRDFIEARMDTSDPRSALAQRHARHFIQVCGARARNVDGHGGATLRHAIALESENLIATVQRAFTEEPPSLSAVTAGLHGTLALEPVLTTRGPHALYVELLSLGLALADGVGVPAALRTRALEARARAHRARHALLASLTDLEEALAWALQARDAVLEARIRANLGTHHLLTGALPEAAEAYEIALRLFDATGERRLHARAVGFMGLLEHERGQLEASVDRYRTALAAHRELGDRRWEAIHMGQLGAVLLEQGRLDHARAELRQAVAVHRELTNRRVEGLALTVLGDVELAADDFESARGRWERALLLLQRMSDPAGEARVLARLAALAAHQGLAAQAAAIRARAKDIAERLASPVLDEVMNLLAEPEASVARGARGEAARAAARVARTLSATSLASDEIRVARHDQPT